MSIEVEIKVKIQNRKQIMDSLKKIGFLENSNYCTTIRKEEH